MSPHRDTSVSARGAPGARPVREARSASEALDARSASEALDARSASEALDARSASDALDALGDPNRRAIVQILSGGARSVQEIADQLPISRPAVSRHLRLLKGAGLVDDRPDGTRHIYELRGEGVDAVRAYFADVWENAATRFRLVAENTDLDDG